MTVGYPAILMSIARLASRVIRQQLRAHVAWLPLANNFELGDFGVISGGRFTRIGNVASLGVGFDARRSTGSPFEFRSSGTREVLVSGDVEVPALSAVSVDARLRIKFADASAMYIRADDLEISEIEDLLPVASALRAHPQWRMRYRVIHRLWTARGGTFITSETSDAQIEFAGSVAALQAFRAGRGALGLTVARTSGVGLDLIGRTGPVALGLFRVRVVDGSPAMLDFATAPPSLRELVDLDEDGADDPADDI